MAKFENLTYAPEETIVRREHAITREAVVKTGRRVADSVNQHVTGDGNITREAVVKTGRRVADSVNQHVTGDGNITREAVVKTGRRAADYVNSHTSNEHSETRRHSDENRDYIVDQLGGRISGWQIIVSLIVAALAGFGTWMASKGYILKDVLDANGNVTGQEPYLPYIILLIVLACVAAFYVTAAILSFFERRR